MIYDKFALPILMLLVAIINALKMNSFTKKIFTIIYVGLALAACQKDEPVQIDKLIWTSIHVSGKSRSGDAHLLSLPDGTFFLIDTGYEEFTETDLLPSLDKLGVSKLTGVLITHAHKNHYGGLLKLAQRYPIETVYFNVPDDAICLKEIKYKRCDPEHIATMMSEVSKLSKVVQLKSGDRLIDLVDHRLQLDVVHHSDSAEEPFLENRAGKKRFSVNDSSIVSRLSYGDMSILFPGDAGSFIGKYLSDNLSSQLDSTLLAAPHHGVNDMPGNSFLDAVSPELIVVSISPPPFAGQRGKALRDYARNVDIPLYVTGYGGSVSIEMNHEKYWVTSGKALNN